MARWFDTGAQGGGGEGDDDRVDWVRVIPFLAMHLACVAVVWVGFSWFAFWVALGLYALRMFAVTAFYHRYFSHRAFKASRPVQFAFAVVGAAAVQRGPLWWAAHHRNHHRHADTPADVHSPVQHGFLHSHMGWFLSRAGFRTDWSKIPDLMKYPELRLLDRRMKVINLALLLCTGSATATCAVVALLFVGELATLLIGTVVALIFILAMLMLVAGLAMFVIEVRMSVHATRIRAELLR